METLASKITEKALPQMGRFEVKKGYCAIHGDFQSGNIGRGWSSCPKCSDEEMKRESIETQRINREEAKRRELESKMKQTAIPLRFQDRTLNNYIADTDQKKHALAMARDFADNFDDVLKTGRSLIFTGDVGTGKTHLSTGIAHQIMREGKAPLFTSVINAIRFVKETYHRDSQMSERQAIKTFIEPDLLILDEVGVQFGSDTEKLILFDIINGRYENMRPTIIISNLSLAKLSEYLTDRVIDRLREGGGKVQIFDWESYRRKA